VGAAAAARAPGAAAAADAAAAALWARLLAAHAAAGPLNVTLPEPRTQARDWVRDGARLPKRAVASAAAHLAAFRRAAPPYPGEPAFAGRGVVILAGGLTYMVPAWVNVAMLRRAGCGLPVELWFPPAEAPTEAMEAALAALGATARVLPASAGAAGAVGGGARRSATAAAEPAHEPPRPRSSPPPPPPPPGEAAGPDNLAPFTMKVAALLLSRFREVIFLDSDNVALSDPSPLLDADAYLDAGAVLWPDYWQSTAAPDLAAIVGLPRSSLPPGSHESGQMAVDKARAWDGLLIAAYMNLEHALYYELLTGFMGKGDKESFAVGLAAAALPFAVAPTPVGSVGRAVTRCVLGQRVCWEAFGGNTMLQAGLDGAPMFLHANLPPKWTLELAADPAARARRWAVVQPGGGDFAALLARAGLPDVEAEVHDALVALRCAPFLPDYAAVLASESRMGAAATLPLGVPAGQLAAANPGMNFRSPYRWGLAGTYTEWAYVGAWDRVAHAAQRGAGVVAAGRWVGRVAAWATGRSFFAPF